MRSRSLKQSLKDKSTSAAGEAVSVLSDIDCNRCGTGVMPRLGNLAAYYKNAAVSVDATSLDIAVPYPQSASMLFNATDHMIDTDTLKTVARRKLASARYGPHALDLNNLAARHARASSILNNLKDCTVDGPPVDIDLEASQATANTFLNQAARGLLDVDALKDAASRANPLPKYEGAIADRLDELSSYHSQTASFLNDIANGKHNLEALKRAAESTTKERLRDLSAQKARASSFLHDVANGVPSSEIAKRELGEAAERIAEDEVSKFTSAALGSKINGLHEISDVGGNLKQKFTCAQGTLEQMSTFSPEGALLTAAAYQNGQLHGLSTTLGEAGKPIQELNYENGILQGLSSNYSPDGILTQAANYADGQLHGPFNTFDVAGKPLEQMNYTAGVLNGQAKSYVNNTLTSERNYVNGQLEGQAKSYLAAGPLQAVNNYVAGKREGAQQYFDQSGQLARVDNYVADVQQGASTGYYPSGAIQDASNYKNGLLDGVKTSYYQNGQPSVIEQYTNGVLGMSQHFTPDGKQVQMP